MTDTKIGSLLLSLNLVYSASVKILETKNSFSLSPVLDEIKLVKTEVKNLSKNLDFFREQNNQIISEIKALKKGIPSQADIQKISLEIENSRLKKFDSEKLLEEVNFKIKSFEEKIEKGKFRTDPDLENITNLLNNLKLGSPKKPVKPSKYKFWMPDNE